MEEAFLNYGTFQKEKLRGPVWRGLSRGYTDSPAGADWWAFSSPNGQCSRPGETISSRVPKWSLCLELSERETPEVRERILFWS